MGQEVEFREGLGIPTSLMHVSQRLPERGKSEWSLRRTPLRRGSRSDPGALMSDFRPKVCLGVPWTVLGMRSLFSDSGFILIYEALMWMNRKFGMVGLIQLDPRYQEVFEDRNVPFAS